MDNQHDKRRIRKVRIDGEDRIEIRYEQMSRNGDGYDEYTMLCRDRARPEFYDAMKALTGSVIELLELPEMYETGMTIRGVTLSYSGDNDTMGATITALKKLSTCNAPVCLNTPHMTIGRLAELIDEVNAYIDGDRAQLQLFTKDAA